MGDLMKQAQKLQQEVERIQQELESMTVEASAGGGMVTVTANGKQDILSIKIDPEVVKPDEVDMLEDLVLAAVNEAKKRAHELMVEEMSKMSGGMSIPGLF